MNEDTLSVSVDQNTQSDRLKLVVVTNIPAPYREPVYEILARDSRVDLHVVYCSNREPDREWDLAGADYPRTFLEEFFLTTSGRFVHFNLDVWGTLKKLKPDVVITTGFNPTHIIAFAYARWFKIPHVAMTDGTFRSELVLGGLHRLVRRFTYKRTAAFIGASEGAFELFRAYQIPDEKMFKSHLCANNTEFFKHTEFDKQYDFIFCGRFVAIKNPFFAVEVAKRTAKLLNRKTSILFVGAGILDRELKAAADLASEFVEVTFNGFALQRDLPQLYGSARIFLFPTLWDPWGVVANEACAAGVPVFVSPYAGVAEELIVHNQNGYMLPMVADAWAEAAAGLLSNAVELLRMGALARQLVAEYSYDNAAKGIALAALQATGSELPENISSALKPAPQRATVLIVQRRMTHYRVPMFEALRVSLSHQGVNLRVAYGNGTRSEAKKNDAGHISWGLRVPTYELFWRTFRWQDLRKVISGVSLIVVTQENRLLFNYLLPILYPKLRWAFWGHGRNFQASKAQTILSEPFKRWYLNRADWWFAYTDISARVLKQSKYPREKITVLNNTIDNEMLHEELAAVSEQDIIAAKKRWNIGTGPVGLMLGSLYPEKRLEFMLEAAQWIRDHVPDFELIIVGDGEERDMARDAAIKSGGWIHWVGALKGKEKAEALRCADVMLNPGMVGLSILDSLIAALPMVTCELKTHSPEIAYLKNGRNGLITSDDPAAFADEVSNLLQDKEWLLKLKGACIEDAKQYTLANMVSRFSNGIVNCLNYVELEAAEKAKKREQR